MLTRDIKEVLMANNQKNEVALNAVAIANGVQKRIDEMTKGHQLELPEDYSVGNALQEAWLRLQAVQDKNGVPALQKCTKESVMTAMLDMAVQGLSPAKNQCYFVPYEDQLTLMRSYMGTVMVAKRFGGVKDVFAQVVYKGDTFEYQIDPATGVREVTKHTQTLENIGNDIVAAYATIIKDDGTKYQEIMTKDQIQKAWNQGATKGKSPAHTNFPEEMAKKTVINRACKLFVNSATDSEILAGAYNRTTENDYKREEADAVVIDVEAEEMKSVADDAIFGESKNADLSEENSKVEEQTIKGPKNATEETGAPLTDEEKEEILRMEKEEAEREARNDD